MKTRDILAPVEAPAESNDLRWIDVANVCLSIAVLTAIIGGWLQ